MIVPMIIKEFNRTYQIMVKTWWNPRTLIDLQYLRSNKRDIILLIVIQDKWLTVFGYFLNILLKISWYKVGDITSDDLSKSCELGFK